MLLLSQAVMEDDLEALALFQAADTGGRRATASNVVGVLSRADQLGDGSVDSWELAAELAAGYAQRLRSQMATVVPLMGLLAETAETAALTELDARQLAALAAMDPDEFERLLWSADRFGSAEASVTTESREHLLALLDLYGVRRVTGLVRGGLSGASALRREVSKLSGIATVKQTILAQFREQDTLLKVRSVLEQLHALTFARTADEHAAARLRALRTDVEALRLAPAMHHIAEMEAGYDCAAGLVALPSTMLEEATRLFGSGTLAERMGIDGADKDQLARSAEEGMRRWRCQLAISASPAVARASPASPTARTSWRGRRARDRAGGRARRRGWVLAAEHRPRDVAHERCRLRPPEREPPRAGIGRPALDAVLCLPGGGRADPRG